ncbi:MAG TPA: caspase family protein [Anaeromyxobacteraceae bacterium]|nr:caspase family protein [Anaeromyxobacteraceae bacterium]
MIAAALTSLLALGAPAEVVQDVRLAVVAGNNLGLDGEQPLEFAELDARRVHAVLTELGGVAFRRATLVLGGGPDELLAAVSEMVGQARELSASAPVTALLYVSAHADEEALHLGGQRLALATLLERFGQAQATLHVAVVDACRIPVGMRPKGGRPVPEVPVVLDQSARVGGDVFIAATGPGELAQEWTHLRGSLFTHQLLVGLRGAADFDGNGRVTLSEAYAFAYRATLARAAEAGLAPQRPSFDFRLAGFGDWVFTQVRGGGSELTLAGDLAGRVWITDQRSDVVAELDKRAGEPVRLALEPGRYRVVRLAGGWAAAADVNLALGGSRRVDEAALIRVRAERALAKGSAPLEQRPWRLVAAWGVTSASAPGMPAQQAFEIGAERALGEWVARLTFGGGRNDFAVERAAISQREVRLSASAAWTFPLGFVMGGVGLEVIPRIVWQSIERSAAVEQVYGDLPGQTALAVGLGPLVTASIPLGERAALGIDLAGGVEWAPDLQGSVGARGFAQARIVGGWAF